MSKIQIIKPIKLSKAQSQVIELLKTGEWELVTSTGTGLVKREWIQKGGIGRGGESIDLRKGTCASLAKKELIQWNLNKGKWNQYIWELTELGKTAEIKTT